MECRKVKDAVLAGLKDPADSIRIAAALNAGRYDDEKLLEALDDFFANQADCKGTRLI